MIIHQIQSPNCSNRKLNATIDSIVIHHTRMADLTVAIDRLCDRHAQVSAHYVIAKNGDIYQLVAEENKAWHAGTSFWRGRDSLNDYSIGIELENTGEEPFMPPQIEALIYLCKDIMKRHNIDLRNIVAHADIAPDRKDDPNIHFPWKALADHGIGIFPAIDVVNNNEILFSLGDSVAKIPEVRHKLAEFGYRLEITNQYDNQMNEVIMAFKRRFCPESFALAGWDKIADSKLNHLYEIIKKGIL